ncbi:MAG: FAS1-like dehydratase domain-containing protein [Pseudonocardia sp.]
MSGLAEYLDGWSPEPLHRVDTVGRRAVDAFAGLLDQQPPDEILPPMWHWFGFLDHPAQAALGTDGHPADGHFLPPIPHRRRMFAGGRWRARRPLRIGQEIGRESSVHSVQPKTGRSGEMVFVTIRHEFTVDGSPAAVEEQDIVYRSESPASPELATARPVVGAAEPPAGTTAGPDTPVPDPEPAEHELRIEPDPTLLFRFSALTYNAHRIHYDQPYATGVEGYPGLVVHGPLLALVALELPRRHHPERIVSELRYRLRRPAFAGAPVVASGWPANRDGWCELSVGEAARPPSLTATARLDDSAKG